MSYSKLFFSTEGRIPRLTYWFFILGYIVAYFVAVLIDILFGTLTDSGFGLFSSVFFPLLGLVPGLIVSIKRCHDRDRSGWYLLLGLIPIVGVFLVFVLALELAFLKGTDGDNKYGSDPLQKYITHSETKELSDTALPVAEVQITKTEFSKLTYRQKFAVTEYGYLLSPEDAENVGKMLGNFQEKDISPFCEANGKKVSKLNLLGKPLVATKLLPAMKEVDFERQAERDTVKKETMAYVEKATKKRDRNISNQTPFFVMIALIVVVTLIFYFSK